ncbi:MAG: hypothetical protein PVK01_05080 [Flavobacteriaceae bacterium]|jgi:hypothetical protein
MTFQYAICLHFKIENDISISRIDKGLLKSFIESKIVNKIFREKPKPIEYLTTSKKFKQKEFQLKTDKIIAYLITLTGIAMMLYPVLLFSKLNIILTVFGVVGTIFGLRDLKQFKDIKRLKKNWLKLHLGKMTGGYIAAVSAFFVVNQILPGIWNWFVPGIIGSGFITYWMVKLNKKKKPEANKV